MSTTPAADTFSYYGPVGILLVMAVLFGGKILP